MRLPTHNASTHTSFVELTTHFFFFQKWIEPQLIWIEQLACILIDSNWRREELYRILTEYSKRSAPSRFQLADELAAKFPSPPSMTRLVEWLQRRTKIAGAFNKAKLARASRCNLTRSQMRRSIPIQFSRELPALPLVSDLAEWLDIPVGLLDWLSKHRKVHYRLRCLRKKSGGLRLLESPRMRLKIVQRQINREILHRIPCHHAAHGFVPGRSPTTAVEKHVGKCVVTRMDLQDFFPSIGASRVFGLFRSLGYPYAVTQLLTDLCTSTCTLSELAAVQGEFPKSAFMIPEALHDVRELYFRKHLPQGAPTSPALANLVAYRLDCRLAGLAASLGLEYTRYADDLIFSGDRFFGRVAKNFASQVGAIAIEEGFRVQFRKTKIMRSGTRQIATGIVLNQTTNCVRTEYDRLKATLHNCVQFGPASQNLKQQPRFREHLQGRINWIGTLNEVRGQKLLKIFNSIDWSRES